MVLHGNNILTQINHLLNIVYPYIALLCSISFIMLYSLFFFFAGFHPSFLNLFLSWSNTISFPFFALHKKISTPRAIFLKHLSFTSISFFFPHLSLWRVYFKILLKLFCVFEALVFSKPVENKFSQTDQGHIRFNILIELL